MNNQSPVKPHNEEFLRVHSIFHSIQGEGPFSGQPAIFIRLAGCNLQCPGCDTEYSAGAEKMSVTEIVSAVRAYPRTELIVLTGGEPMLQPIEDLVRTLCSVRVVQIETNGTRFVDLPSSGVPIVCSPKTPHLDQAMKNRIAFYKYVLQHGQVAVDGLPTQCFGGNSNAPARPPENFPRSNIYVSPFDDGTLDGRKLNTNAAVKSCLEHGYTLCLQIHKLIGLE